MAKQKGKQEARKPSPTERLMVRVSEMINSPIAQLGRRVMIHRLDDDPEEVWGAMLEALAETDGLEMIFNDDGTVTLQWESPAGEEGVADRGEVELEEEEVPF